MTIKKQVLLIGPENFGYNQSIASAFNSDLFHVRVIDYAEQYGRICLANKCRYFVASDRKKITHRLLDEMNDYLVRQFNYVHPDIVIIIKGDTIFPKTVQAMAGVQRILWMMDGIHYNPQSIQLVKDMEAVFLFEKSDVEKVKQLNPNTHYLPSAVDEKIYRKLDLPKDIDLLFIGTLYPDRIELLHKIRKAFPQLKMKVYCERYRFYKHPVKFIQSLFDKTFINRFVPPKKANRLYNRAKICLNMHHEQSVYGINPRFFEIAGTESLLFTDHRPFIDDFLAGYKIHSYKTEDELFSMIHDHFYGTKKEIDRGLIQKIRMNHTYRNRIDYVLNHI